MVTQKCQFSNPVIMVFMQIWIIMATIFEEIAAEHEALLMIDIQQSDGTGFYEIYTCIFIYICFYM